MKEDIKSKDKMNQHVVYLKIIVPISYHAHLDRLPVVDFDNMEAETIHSFSWSHEYACCWIKMTANVHQDLETHTNNPPLPLLDHLTMSLYKP